MVEWALQHPVMTFILAVLALAAAVDISGSISSAIRHWRK